MTRRTRPFALLPPLLAALTASAAAASPAPAAEAPPRPPPARPNLVLVTLDTVRADHLGAYGYRAARTPVLDALAARGARFARADCSAPITLPSHATILTGLLPPRHGVRDNGTFTLGADRETVAEVLRAAGWDTGAAVSAVVLARRYGVDQGFRLWDEELGEEGGGPAEERDAAAVTGAALELLGKLERPFFLWVHYYDPHFDYRPPARLLEAQRGDHRAYDAEIAHADEQLGRLLAALPADTVVAAVGDHGEMLGEHGEETHGVLLHAGARRVPLLIAGPGVPAGRVIEPLVSTADLAPTLLALAGAPPLAAIDGESLLPLLAAGREPARVAYSESFLPLFAHRWYPLRALSDGRWLYVDAPAPRLYDLAADPAETRDLAAARPEEAARWRGRLRQRLERWGELEESPEPAAVSDEERRRLAALGYLAGGGRAGDLEGLPDPHGLVDLVAELREAGELVQADRCEEALPRLRAAVRRSRDSLPVLTMTGSCLMAEERWAEAARVLEHAVEVHPDSTVARANLAGSLLELGRPAEAEAAYRETLARDPAMPQAVANLARLLRERGAAAEALAVLEAGFAAGGDHPGWRLERGLIRAGRGELAAALGDFLAAVAAEPGNRVALEDAARAAYRLGRFGQSAGLYRRLADLDPSRSGPWKTLGAIQLHQLGDAAAARDSFRRALAVERDPADRAELEALLAELGG